jgi:glycosyltransferase involved in cell wall biosynthesis
MVADEFFNMIRKPVRYRLFFAGNVSKSKGIEDLLAAFVHLAEKYKKMELRIAGNFAPTYKEDLIKKMELVPFGPRVKFLGHLDRKEMLREYSETDVFVFPSYFETSPNVIMEAMSVGLPIVSTFAGGIPDMITNEKNGLLVKTGSPLDLAHNIAFLFENRDQAQKLGAQAKRDALQRFKQEIVTEKTVALYKKILTA